MSLSRILMVLAVGAGLLVTSGLSQESSFSISLKGSLTTGSQLFPNPNSPDEARRAQFFSLDNIWGYGLEVRYRFPESDLAIALSADYLRKTSESSIRTATTVVPVADGYRVIPIELTGYFLIPISGETFTIFMGGGVGTYLGRRIYRVGDVEARTVDQGRGFGIHVLSGVGYRVYGPFSIVAEMKFRDLQFNSVNRFEQAHVQYGGTLVNVGTEPFESRVHTDGVIFQLGAMIEW